LPFLALGIKKGSIQDEAVDDRSKANMAYPPAQIKFAD
jgi:hypothetical protein